MGTLTPDPRAAPAHWGDFIERGRPVVGLLLLLVTGFAYAQVMSIPRYSDEAHHLRQIGKLVAGDFTLDSRITTIPGYHYLSSLIARAVGDQSAASMRLVNATFGMLSVYVFFLAARARGASQPMLRTLHYYFLPLAFPYHFLVYTDSISLLAVLLATLLVLKKRHVAAGLVGCASLLLRQTNVAWLAFLCLYTLAEDGRLPATRAAAQAYLRKVWPCLLGAAAFVAFVIVNGGVALRDRGSHPPGLYSGNVFLCLSLFCVLFLPGNIARLWHGRARLTELRLLVLVAAAALLFVLTFRADHPYNQFQGFLRNDLLHLVEANAWAKATFFGSTVLALAALYVTPLARKSFRVLYPIALLTLLPSWLIEHRYYLVPYALFLLFREDEPPAAEGLGLAESAVLSGLFLYGISRSLVAL